MDKSKTPSGSMRQGDSRFLPKKIGNYRIQSKLGQGSMGVVYPGKDPALDRHVELRLDLGEHNIALRHSEKLMKSVKYTSEHTFFVTAQNTFIEVTSKLASTHFRLKDKLPGFFQKEYVKVEPESGDQDL